MIDSFIVSNKSTILDTIKVIDNNRKGFAIVVDDNQKVVGVITDGDIRRALIRGENLDGQVINVCMKIYKSLNNTQTLRDAVEIFKDEKVDFLPIININGVVENVITKTQMHALLLRGLDVSLEYDFDSIDENILTNEIYPRPWGFYKTTLYNEFFKSKILNIHPREKISLQVHKKREEYWTVVHGSGIAQIGDSIVNIEVGSSLFIPKGCKHRLTNTDDKESLVIAEVQIGDYLGEDDVYRYEDIYGRNTVND